MSLPQLNRKSVDIPSKNENRGKKIKDEEEADPRRPALEADSNLLFKSNSYATVGGGTSY